MRSAISQDSALAPKFLAADVPSKAKLLASSMIGSVTTRDIFKVRYALPIEIVRRAYGIVDKNC